VSTLAQPAPRPATTRQRAAVRLRTWLPAVVIFALGILAWQWILPDGLHVKRFLLPRFSAVMTTFWDERHTLWSAGWFTFKEALAGFALGCSVAFLLALVLARWQPLGRALMPYAIAANAIPIIAFAPITNAWFGLLSPWSKIVIAAVLCFFPVLVNSLRGLTSVRPESLELMRSYAASEVDVFRRVRIPTSLPFVFTALKVASVLAMIGAVVGDYFGGSTKALGIQIQSSVTLSQYEYAWSAILVASILGIAFYAAIALVERLALSWHPSTRKEAQ
jgi:NitT/TauT family transport system permease protein